jgi:hypothetical protein
MSKRSRCTVQFKNETLCYCWSADECNFIARYKSNCQRPRNGTVKRPFHKVTLSGSALPLKQQWNLSRAIVHEVSRWFPTAAARVRGREEHLEYVMDKMALVSDFIRILRFPLPIIIPPISPILIITQVGTIRLMVDTVPSEHNWTPPPPRFELINYKHWNLN